MTGEEIKGGKREKSVEVDTDLSWDHEGLKPLPKAPKNRLDESPKPPRVPKAPRAKTDAEETSKKGYSANGGDIKEGKYPKIPSRMNESKKEISPEIKQDADTSKRGDKHNEKLNLESHDKPVDKKTARWIEEQNEFMGKQKERDVPIFKPNGPVKVLQRQSATRHTGYEQPPQPLMGAQGGQAPQLPMIVTNQKSGSWGSQGKRYPVKERLRNQWGGYGKQYGASNERRGYQTYGTDRTPPQNHNTAYGSQRQGSYVPTRSTGNGQGGNGRNGDENDKKKYKDTRSSQESNSHEESDTEDSPGGGALKIKLSKKKPLKITAGAPDGQLQTIQMELECIPSFRQPDPRSQVDTTSESTLPTRGLGAPLLILLIHPENNVRPQKGTSPKKENDLKGSTNYGLTKERVTQVQSSGTWESQGPVRIKNPPGNRGGGDSSGGTSGEQRFPGEGRGPPRRNNKSGRRRRR